jgi:hypothetical protein
MQAEGTMKHSLITTCLLISCMLTFGQKENSVRSFHGIDVSVFPYMDNRYNFNIESPSGYLGYYFEQAIARTWTLRLTAGVQEVYGKGYVFDDQHWWERLHLEQIYKVGVEPRWYYAYKKRFAAGEALLNSGWFLSLPISMEIMYNCVNEGFNTVDYEPEYLKSFHVLPAWGFRSAFSRHFYWEGAAGLDFGFGQYIRFSQDFFPRHDYSIRLSVGYVF